MNGTVKSTIPVGDHPVDVAADDHGVWTAMPPRRDSRPMVDNGVREVNHPQHAWHVADTEYWVLIQRLNMKAEETRRRRREAAIGEAGPAAAASRRRRRPTQPVRTCMASLRRPGMKGPLTWGDAGRIPMQWGDCTPQKRWSSPSGPSRAGWRQS